MKMFEHGLVETYAREEVEEGLRDAVVMVSDHCTCSLYNT